MENKFDVVILAGARNEGPLQEVSSDPYEALIPVGAHTMVEHVLKAVRSSAFSDRILVVGPEKELQELLPEDIIVIQGTSSMVDNIKLGAQEFSSSEYILVVTSDIPLVTAGAIDDFLHACQEREADIYYPLISKQVNVRKYPGVKRTYVHLTDGTFTGGNMVLLKTEIIEQCQAMLEKVVSWRKKPWKLSQLLGFKFIIKFFLGQLSLEEIEERVSQIIGFKGVGLVTEYPEIGFDVDKPSDLERMQEIFASDSTGKAN
ncbi:MAG: nucleotidyltransferase family protein [Halanaerobium sp.]|nr:nucleotidyltransferase family protein [Halanaerobium sp.]